MVTLFWSKMPEPRKAPRPGGNSRGCSKEHQHPVAPSAEVGKIERQRRRKGWWAECRLQEPLTRKNPSIANTPHFGKIPFTP